MRGRLGDPHVLARLHRPDSRKRVPVVRRQDRDRINLLVLIQLAQVGIGLRLGPVLLGEMFFDDAREQILVHVTQRRHLDIRQRRELLEMRLSHPVDADDSDAHAVVGAGPRAVGAHK